MAKRKTARARDIRQLMEAHGIGGRTVVEYRHAPQALAGADDQEMTIGGLLVSDQHRSWYMEGEAVSPAEVRAWLAERSGAIRLRLNSPGGDYFAGVEIMNALRDYEGEVAVKVVGLAASAASLVAMGGDTIEMQAGTLLMIHRSWSLGIGSAVELRAIANRLELIDGQAAQIYAARAGAEPDEMLALMDAETWLDAASAIELGLADGQDDDMAEDEDEDMAEGEEPDADMNAEAGEEPAPSKPDTTQQEAADRARATSFAWLAQRLALLNGDTE